MKVPFIDLAPGIAADRDEYVSAFETIIDSGRFVGGAAVAGLEREFAEFCGTAHCVAVSSGTDALVLALRALGIGNGDEVITAPNSFIATAEAIALVGATPVFADVRDDTLTIDPAAVAQRVTARTRAIIPVHLFGQVADMDALRAISAGSGAVLIEDACQAHGARRDGQRAGSIGRVAAFSFYPTKNLGAFGEGGAVTTDDANIASAVRKLLDHGQASKHDHELVGYNARLNAIQCACLSIRLRRLEDDNRDRRRAAERYRAALAGVGGVRLVAEDAQTECVYHLFVVRVAARDQLRSVLGAAEIGNAVHYPVPIHLQPAFAHLGYSAGEFPVAEQAAKEMITLPMYPGLTDEAVDYVVDVLRRGIG